MKDEKGHGLERCWPCTRWLGWGTRMVKSSGILLTLFIITEQSPDSKQGYPAFAMVEFWLLQTGVFLPRLPASLFVSVVPVLLQPDVHQDTQWHLFSTHAYVLLQQTPKYLDSNFTLVPWELKDWCNSFNHPHLWPFWIMHEYVRKIRTPVRHESIPCVFSSPTSLPIKQRLALAVKQGVISI